jgi:hypothetical protein
LLPPPLPPLQLPSTSAAHSTPLHPRSLPPPLQVTKPVVAWVSGTCAKLFKTEVQFGHAGARSGGDLESAQAKNAALSAAGATVPESFEGLEGAVRWVAGVGVAGWGGGRVISGKRSSPPATIGLGWQWRRQWTGPGAALCGWAEVAGRACVWWPWRRVRAAACAASAHLHILLQVLINRFIMLSKPAYPGSRRLHALPPSPPTL